MSIMRQKGGTPRLGALLGCGLWLSCGVIDQMGVVLSDQFFEPGGVVGEFVAECGVGGLEAADLDAVALEDFGGFVFCGDEGLKSGRG